MFRFCFTVRIISCCVLAVLIASCTTAKQPTERMRLQIADYAHLKGWQHDDHKAAFTTFLRSCEAFKKIPANKKITVGNYRYKAEKWQHICLHAQNISMKQSSIRKFFEDYFTPFHVVSDTKGSHGLFTGYYEIDLYGSKKRVPPYTYPLYSLPTEDELRTLSRADIEAGALQGKGLELLYVDDPIAAFFLHIQGSGRVHLPSGEVVRVGYAGQNGRAYFAIGKYFLERNILTKDNVSAEAIKKWLYSHPEEAQEIMNQNASYVYFRLIDSMDGPIGAQGVPLTEDRSLAIDTRYIPLGSPLWLETESPSVAKDHHFHPFRRLMIAQDKGGAIKGVVRGDIFFGHGTRAAIKAGYMKAKGKYYILLPR